MEIQPPGQYTPHPEDDRTYVFIVWAFTGMGTHVRIICSTLEHAEARVKGMRGDPDAEYSYYIDEDILRLYIEKVELDHLFGGTDMQRLTRQQDAQALMSMVQLEKVGGHSRLFRREDERNVGDLKPCIICGHEYDDHHHLRGACHATIQNDEPYSGVWGTGSRCECTMYYRDLKEITKDGD